MERKAENTSKYDLIYNQDNIEEDPLDIKEDPLEIKEYCEDVSADDHGIRETTSEDFSWNLDYLKINSIKVEPTEDSEKLEKSLKFDALDYNFTLSNNIDVDISEGDKCEDTLPSDTGKKRKCRSLRDNKCNETQKQSRIKFSCSKCDFTTWTHVCLKVHRAIHSNEKPYQCAICNYSTKFGSNLHIHKRKYHPESKVNLKDRKKFWLKRKKNWCKPKKKKRSSSVVPRECEHDFEKITRMCIHCGLSDLRLLRAHEETSICKDGRELGAKSLLSENHKEPHSKDIENASVSDAKISQPTEDIDTNSSHDNIVRDDHNLKRKLSRQKDDKDVRNKRQKLSSKLGVKRKPNLRPKRNEEIVCISDSDEDSVLKDKTEVEDTFLKSHSDRNKSNSNKNKSHSDRNKSNSNKNKSHSDRNKSNSNKNKSHSDRNKSNSNKSTTFSTNLKSFRKECVSDVKISQPIEDYKPSMESNSKKKVGRIVYKCKMCRFSTHNKVHFADHEFSHTGERPYTCLKCNFSSSYRGNLARHKHVCFGTKDKGIEVKNKHENSLRKNSNQRKANIRVLNQRRKKLRSLNVIPNPNLRQKDDKEIVETQKHEAEETFQKLHSDGDENKSEEESNNSSVSLRLFRKKSLENNKELGNSHKTNDLNNTCDYTTQTQTQMNFQEANPTDRFIYKCSKCNFTTKDKLQYVRHKRWKKFCDGYKRKTEKKEMKRTNRDVRFSDKIESKVKVSVIKETSSGHKRKTEKKVIKRRKRDARFSDKIESKVKISVIKETSSGNKRISRRRKNKQEKVEVVIDSDSDEELNQDRELHFNKMNNNSNNNNIEAKSNNDNRKGEIYNNSSSSDVNLDAKQSCEMDYEAQLMKFFPADSENSYDDEALIQIFFQKAEVLLEKLKLHFCLICDFVSQSSSKLEKHKSEVHSRSKKYECLKCSFASVTWRGLRRHEVIHKKNVPEENFSSESKIIINKRITYRNNRNNTNGQSKVKPHADTFASNALFNDKVKEEVCLALQTSEYVRINMNEVENVLNQNFENIKSNCQIAGNDNESNTNRQNEYEPQIDPPLANASFLNQKQSNNDNDDDDYGGGDGGNDDDDSCTTPSTLENVQINMNKTEKVLSQNFSDIESNSYVAKINNKNIRNVENVDLNNVREIICEVVNEKVTSILSDILGIEIAEKPSEKNASKLSAKVCESEQDLKETKHSQTDYKVDKPDDKTSFDYLSKAIELYKKSLKDSDEVESDSNDTNMITEGNTVKDSFNNLERRENDVVENRFEKDKYITQRISLKESSINTNVENCTSSQSNISEHREKENYADPNTKSELLATNTSEVNTHSHWSNVECIKTSSDESSLKDENISESKLYKKSFFGYDSFPQRNQNKQDLVFDIADRESKPCEKVTIIDEIKGTSRIPLHSKSISSNYNKSLRRITTADGDDNIISSFGNGLRPSLKSLSSINTERKKTNLTITHPIHSNETTSFESPPLIETVPKNYMLNNDKPLHIYDVNSMNKSNTSICEDNLRSNNCTNVQELPRHLSNVSYRSNGLVSFNSDSNSSRFLVPGNLNINVEVSQSPITYSNRELTGAASFPTMSGITEEASHLLRTVPKSSISQYPLLTNLVSGYSPNHVNKVSGSQDEIIMEGYDIPVDHIIRNPLEIVQPIKIPFDECKEKNDSSLGGDFIYRCNKCNYVTNVKSYFSRHYLEVHT
ncbi:UNVERIFIED_CONTAM: hypothetical protein RMT77_015877 [Armadillidium vulgare]